MNAVDLGRDTDTVACVAGAIAGARSSVQSIPSRWTTYLDGTVKHPTGAATYDYASLQSLARKLLGQHEVADPADEPADGPAQVHDEFPIYAANRLGAAAALDDWRVISLRRTGESFSARDVRRQVFLVDKSESHHNEYPLAVLTDVVDTIDAFLAEDSGQPILVHCHGGRNRTAFVHKAWAMRLFGWSEQQAHEWLEKSWARIDRRNDRFVKILRDEWLPAPRSAIPQTPGRSGTYAAYGAASDSLGRTGSGFGEGVKAIRHVARRPQIDSATIHRWSSAITLLRKCR